MIKYPFMAFMVVIMVVTIAIATYNTVFAEQVIVIDPESGELYRGARQDEAVIIIDPEPINPDPDRRNNHKTPETPDPYEGWRLPPGVMTPDELERFDKYGY